MDRASGQKARKVAQLYDANIDGAVRFAYLMCGDESLAQDLAHEAFVRVAARLDALRSPDKLPAYLRTTIVNGYRSHLRKARRERAYVEAAARQAPQDETPDLDTRRIVRVALDRLPPRRRAAVILRYYEDLTEREAADVLGCSVPAVKALVARGLETLRAVLEGDTA